MRNWFSSYDLLDDFSAFEAACLIAGLTPIAGLYDEDGFTELDRHNVDVIVTAIKAAYGNAYDAYSNLLADIFFEKVTEDDASENFTWDVPNELPSLTLRRAFLRPETPGGNIADEPGAPLGLRNLDPFKDRFSRDDITQWLVNRRYTDAKYFLPDPTTEPSPDTTPESDNAKLSDLVKQNRQLEEENERLRKQLQEAKKPAQSDETQLSFRHATKRLKLVAAVQERYWGDNYNLSDPDSRTTKSLITEWIKEQDGSLSSRDADAIDAVAVPDGAR